MRETAVKSDKSFNPFYALLVVVGCLFVITATAYFVMTLRDAKPGVSGSPHPLMDFVEKRGLTAMVVELALLGIGTVGAIAFDDLFARRSRRERRP